MFCFTLLSWLKIEVLTGLSKLFFDKMAILQKIDCSKQSFTLLLLSPTHLTWTTTIFNIDVLVETGSLPGYVTSSFIQF
jgi:hypothetical protein